MNITGVPVIGYPVEKLIEASADPAGSAAATLNVLKENAAKLHAGDESYVIKPIDYNDQGKELYTFDLVGISGSGKQYDTGEVIRQYQNEILTVFCASLLKLGQDASGSFALSDNMNNMLAFGVEHNLEIITNQINNDLIPQTLAANGWLLDEEEMPKLVHGEILQTSLEELGKFVQRVVTSGAMSIDKTVDNRLREAAGFTPIEYETAEPIDENFKSSKQSAAGKGNGTSGTGDSQMAAGGDMNSENVA